SEITVASVTHAAASGSGVVKSVNDPVAPGPATSDATQAGTPSSGQKTTQQETAAGADTKQPLRRKAKTFSLNTYKFHAIGDYASTIQTFGTVDSYSTETGELEHRVPKGNYKRTSKKFNFQRQLVQIERRQARLRRIEQSVEPPTDRPQGGDIHEDSLASFVDPG
ncbi:hypothetical protein DXG01_013669, partial [Tephrocybe rancida]